MSTTSGSDEKVDSVMLPRGPVTNGQLRLPLPPSVSAHAAASGGLSRISTTDSQFTDVSDKFSRTSSTVPLTNLLHTSPTPHCAPGGHHCDDDSLDRAAQGGPGGPAPLHPERGNWSGRFDFLLSLLGYSVGLGNVWRFPYLCYVNGGGAFLFPFIIMLVTVGLPLMFLELAFGQYASLGPIAIYEKFCPLFQGLGYGMIIVSGTVCLYYNMIIAWSIFYMFASFSRILPWETCDSDWSTPECYSYQEADKCQKASSSPAVIAANSSSNVSVARGNIFYDNTCYNSSMAQRLNITVELAHNASKKAPADLYFQKYALGMSSGIEEVTEIRWQLALCLLLAWIVVFLCLSKGVKTSGKVVYFTALFPYLVLVVLFFRGITLPGAYKGIAWYVKPNMTKIAEPTVWRDAAVQIFFALSPAWGGLITLASYNKFHNNCFKDAVIVSISNVLTSIFAGFVIFSIVGFLAEEMDKSVDKVVDEGAGLAFVVLPEVVTRLPISPLWSFLFFFMLITLGLDSQFALLETVITAILDRFPWLREKKTWVVLVACLTGYIGGIIFCTDGGVWWLTLVDTYAASWCVLIMAITECILIAWLYGAPRFLNDIESMIGDRSKTFHLVWTLMWRFVSPLTLLAILVFNWIKYTPLKSGSYVYPDWANAIGWIMSLLPLAAVFGTASALLIKYRQQPIKQTPSMERCCFPLHSTTVGTPCIYLLQLRYIHMLWTYIRLRTSPG